MKQKHKQEGTQVFIQPPSGGCVLKPDSALKGVARKIQPPSGGCVLKLRMVRGFVIMAAQPPSGGCVLKQDNTEISETKDAPAAFRRLCVETECWYLNTPTVPMPAAFRRLCVETVMRCGRGGLSVPAAFRRLCVETANKSATGIEALTSRLQAAVC